MVQEAAVIKPKVENYLDLQLQLRLLLHHHLPFIYPSFQLLQLLFATLLLSATPLLLFATLLLSATPLLFATPLLYLFLAFLVTSSEKVRLGGLS